MLNKTNTSDVDRSFYRQYPKNKGTISSNNEINPHKVEMEKEKEKEKEEEGGNQIISNFIKVMKGEQSLSSDTERK